MDPNPNQPRFRSSGALSESSYRPKRTFAERSRPARSRPETRKDPHPRGWGPARPGHLPDLVEGRITVPTVETIHDASPVSSTDVRDADRAVAMAMIHERGHFEP